MPKKKVYKKTPRKKSSNPWKKIILLILAILALVGLGFLIKSKMQPLLPDSEKQQIDKKVTEIMNKYNIPGVTVGIWIPGKGDYVKSYGYANKDTKQPMDTSMSFRIGSLTKSFISTILLQLQDEGKLNLDDPVSKYIPAVPNGNNITLRQLANMTSGLFNYTEDESFWKQQQANTQKEWTPQELIGIALQHPPYFAPGTNYHYSNTNYALLGMVIEKVTGNKLADEIKKRIAEPLGLSNTFYATNSSMPANSVTGYQLTNPDTNEFIDATNQNPSWGGAAGAIVSTIGDLKKWAEAVGQGELISPKAQQERLTWVDEPNGGEISKYGLGVMKIGNFIGHEGEIDGYNSAFAYLPSKNAVIVVTQNTYPNQIEGIAGGLMAQIAKIVLPQDVSW